MLRLCNLCTYAPTLESRHTVFQEEMKPIGVECTAPGVQKCPRERYIQDSGLRLVPKRAETLPEPLVHAPRMIRRYACGPNIGERRRSSGQVEGSTLLAPCREERKTFRLRQKDASKFGFRGTPSD